MSMVSKSQQGRRALVMTSQFKKDLKRARKRGLPNRLANRGNQDCPTGMTEFAFCIRAAC